MTALGELLHDYVEHGDLAGFRGWCAANGWRVVTREGWRLAYDDDGHLRAAAVTSVRDARRTAMSKIPCSGCGSLPTGEYGVGADSDARRRYSCGSHEKAAPESPMDD